MINIKSLLIVLFFFVFVVNVYSQNTGFTLKEQEDVSGVSCTIVQDGNPATCYSFKQTRVSGPTTGYTIWEKVYPNTYSIASVVIDMRGALPYTVRVALQLAGTSGTTTTSFNYPPFATAFEPYNFPLAIPGNYDTVRFALSFLINEWGARDLRLDNIRFVLTNGDTVIMDPGNGTSPTIPLPPVLISPANGSTTTSPVNLVWNSSYQASSYRVQVIQGTTVVFDQTTSNTNITVSLPVNCCYCWRVSASNSAGTSDWSSTWYFDIGPLVPPVPPPPYTPPTGSVGIGLTPILSWGSSGSDILYHIQVATSSSFGGTTVVYENAGITGTAIQLPMLQSFMTYYWRVRAKYVSGTVWSNWTMVLNFMTVCSTEVQQIGNEIPNKFDLSQNYPNPFNPVTKVSFDLPKQSFVSLKVYDITGREIATLVNEELSAGKYVSDFDASKLSSGTYFYRLETGDFIATKKMILLK